MGGKGAFPHCLLLSVFLFSVVVSAGESNHRYKDGEPVKLWVNKVGHWFCGYATLELLQASIQLLPITRLQSYWKPAYNCCPLPDFWANSIA